MEDILQAFKATGSLRRSMATVNTSTSEQKSKMLLSSTSLTNIPNNSRFNSTGLTGQTKVDRVAEILLRVKSLTKKLDNKDNKESNENNGNKGRGKGKELGQSMSSVTSAMTNSIDLSLLARGGKAMEREIKKEKERDKENIGEGGERLDGTWSLKNPMHSGRGEKGKEKQRDSKSRDVDMDTDRDIDEEISADVDMQMGERIKPHRYGRGSDMIEEEEEEDLISHDENDDDHDDNDEDEDDYDDSTKDDALKEYSERDLLLTR